MINEKKVKEAIKHFKHLKDVLENYLKMPNAEENLGAEIVFIKKDIEVYETTIEALEKQLPKRPASKRNAYGGKNVCQVCGASDYGKYCKWCGQRLDWSE